MKTLIAMLALAGYLWTDAASAADEEITVEDTAAMCAALYYSGVQSSSPDVRDILYERASWWMKFTTQAEVDHYLGILMSVIAEAIAQNKVAEVQNLMREGVNACNELMDDAKAATQE